MKRLTPSHLSPVVVLLAPGQLCVSLSRWILRRGHWLQEQLRRLRPQLPDRVLGGRNRRDLRDSAAKSCQHLVSSTR